VKAHRVVVVVVVIIIIIIAVTRIFLIICTNGTNSVEFLSGRHLAHFLLARSLY
jgi:hypothetical protein